MRRTALVIAGALLGIVASASVAWLASQVAGQRIGLSSEPASVAAGLVPRSTSDPQRPALKQRQTATAPSRKSTQAVTPVPTTPSSSGVAVLPASPAPTVTPSTAAAPSPPKHHEDSGGSGSGGGSSGSQQDD